MTFDLAAYLAAEKRLHETAVEYAQQQGSAVALGDFVAAARDYEAALFADGIATAVKSRTRRSTELTAAKCEELGHEVIEACFRCGREAHEIYGGGS